MNDKLLIREVRDDDIPGLMELYRQLHPNDPLPTGPTLDDASRRIRNQPGMQILVAQFEAELVATCTLAVIPNLTRSCRPYALIENVVTHESYRRRGVGAAVVQAAIDTAWRRNCYKVMLLTGQKDDGTRRFYESCGLSADEKTGYVIRCDEQYTAR